MTVTQTPPASALRAFAVSVLAAERISPTYRRLTLGGKALREFTDHGPLGPRDLRVKLVIPSDGTAAAPGLSDQSPGWYQRWRSSDPAAIACLRTYTVRRTRLTAPVPQIDIDFVLHGDGRAATWAGRARPGDRVTVIGPNARGADYGGIEWRPPVPQDRPVRVLLAGDETALPAIGSVLETMPADYHGDVVVEVPSRHDVQDLPTAADVALHWIARDAGPGQATALDRAVRSVLRRPPAPRDAYAWLAGEAGTVRALRRHLLQDLGLERSQVTFMGYWRRGWTEDR